MDRLRAVRENSQFRREGVFTWPLRKAAIAVAALCGLTLLLSATPAFSRLPGALPTPSTIPFTVDSEFTHYRADGSSFIGMYATSFIDNGRELLLESSIPGQPLASAMRHVVDSVGLFIFDFTRPFRPVAEKAARVNAQTRVKNGCVDGLVVGRETILGYPTVAIADRSSDERMTIWMAPDLGCFVLRLTLEDRQPDGTLRLVTKKEALRVQWSR